MENHIGKFYSIKCEDGQVYQGQISFVDQSRVLLEKAFCDGRPCPTQTATILTREIKDVQLLPSPTTPSASSLSGLILPVGAERKVTQPVPNVKVERPVPLRISPRVKVEVQKKDKHRQRWADRNEEAFGSPVDPTLRPDFDFEKNLALFDKKAVFDEINASKPDLVRQVERKANLSYRCDQNVLNSEAVRFRQIQLKELPRLEYVTDTGLIVPSVSTALRRRIASFSEDAGLSFAKHAELVGRAATELSLHLLGGAHRLNPQNQHQIPCVVVLIGSHRGAVQACACARQLASHGVRVTVFFLETGVAVNKEVMGELQLLRLAGCTITSDLQDLLQMPVDLIVVGLSDSLDSLPTPSSAASRWAHGHRAPVLCVDPPAPGITGLTAKCSVVPFLPLAHDQANGIIYLCNVGVPAAVYSTIGIRYLSPFGPKFVMPLHRNDA